VNLGTLTFGRQRSLGTDAMLAYDPAIGAYSFSFIGYNGLMAGGGDTQDTRWDYSLKYRITYGPVHLGAMYKFASGQGGCFSDSATWTAFTCTPEDPHNTAYGLDLGGVYNNFAGDVVLQHVNQAISVLNPLLGLFFPYRKRCKGSDTTRSPNRPAKPAFCALLPLQAHHRKTRIRARVEEAIGQLRQTCRITGIAFGVDLDHEEAEDAARAGGSMLGR
jgi:hypothetical protein